MSAPTLDHSVSAQPETKPQFQPQLEISSTPQQDIANLAYAIWQQRGCPEGSSEQDWLEAERMQAGQQK